MAVPVRVLLAAAILCAVLSVTGLPAVAAPVAVDRGNLVTAEQLAQGSTREGWRAVKDRGGVFDCGAFGVLTSGASDRARRVFASAEDASGLSYAAAFQGRERARVSYRRVLSAVRTCIGSSGRVRVRADERVEGSGVIRLVQLFFRTACCGSDTHTFGVVRRQNRVAVVKIGELGRSPVAPMRAVARAAGEQLAR